MGMRRVCLLGLLPALLLVGLPMAALGQSEVAGGKGGGTVQAQQWSARKLPGAFDAAPWLNAGAGESQSFSGESSGKQTGGFENGTTEGYHWKGLLWQSFAFIGAENGFRLATDHYLRHLIAGGPYWRNYAESLQHWDMTRWSDGDDFVVDDIGHPMQGAVSAYIEIQNSPSQRRLRFSNSSIYWKSRFKALLWATAYSTQQKIGPLGEAAIGNDGGYTYPLGCGEICNDPKAEYGNNTGWTDFIMTPVGGTAWVVGEDLLDRYVSDRVQEAHPDSIFPKILRGALNPTRTAANALRGKTPWYRDYEHPEAASSAGVYVDKGWGVTDLPRYEIFPHFNALSIPVNTASCWFCRRWTKGGGVGFSARLSRWVDFDSDVDYQPDISPVASNRAGGSLLMATFGVRTGFATPRYSLKVALRPGFVSYDHAYLTLPSETNPTPAIGRVTHFATALAINGDYAFARHLGVRWEFGNIPVRYLHSISGPGIGKPPRLYWLSHESFMTNENWTYQVGPVLRF